MDRKGAGKPHLFVEKLDFSYGCETILKEISFQVEEGGFVAIVGPNGSGKSTLLKNLSAALTPMSGQVFLEGASLFQVPPKELAKKMAVVPQETGVQFPFTVMETVLMGRMPHQKRFQGDSEGDLARVKEALERTNTWHLRDRSIMELSGGERQRVIVARALAQEPQILLLDEPTAHLDLQHQMELLHLLKALNEESKVTVLAVLHDLNLAAQFSKYVLLLHNTHIFAAGSPEEVLTAGNIRQVYGMEVVIAPNHLTGKFNIIPVALSKPMASPSKPPAIHLICGGGTGSFLMEQLVQQGYQVSCGVVNIGDTDWSKAQSLGIPMVEEMPFTPISEETYEQNCNLLKKSQIVVVLPIPFGHGNVGNLRQALGAYQMGKEVFLVGEEDLSGRDFTGGKAKEIYDTLLEGGVQVIPQAMELLSLLGDLQGENHQGEKRND